MFNCTSKPLQGGKDGPSLHKVYMMSQSNRGSICRALSQILLLPRRKPYFSSAASPCETARLQPGGGLCLYKREMGAVSEWRRCLTSTNPSTSVCARLRQLFDLMCFPDDLSVFTPRTLQSAKDTERTLTLGKLYFEFLGIPLVVFVEVLAYFFPY